MCHANHLPTSTITIIERYRDNKMSRISLIDFHICSLISTARESEVLKIIPPSLPSPSLDTDFTQTSVVKNGTHPWRTRVWGTLFFKPPKKGYGCLKKGSPTLIGSWFIMFHDGLCSMMLYEDWWRLIFAAMVDAIDVYNWDPTRICIFTLTKIPWCLHLDHFVIVPRGVPVQYNLYQSHGFPSIHQ